MTTSSPPEEFSSHTPYQGHAPAPSGRRGSSGGYEYPDPTGLVPVFICDFFSVSALPEASAKKHARKIDEDDYDEADEDDLSNLSPRNCG